MRSEIESLQQSSHEYDDKVAALFKQLEEKDGKLRKLTSERQKHLQEVYEMKYDIINIFYQLVIDFVITL